MKIFNRNLLLKIDSSLKRDDRLNNYTGLQTRHLSTSSTSADLVLLSQTNAGTFCRYILN